MGFSRWIVLGVLALAAAGCGKKANVGDPCKKDGETVCKDKKNAFVCVDGKFEAMACRANTGCMKGGAASDNCTNLSYEVGEPCFKTGVFECTTDKHGMLECKDKRWALVEKCLGQNGCVANAKGAKCDMSISEEGAPCHSENTFACSKDGKMMLRCDGTKVTAHANCPGQHGCRKQFQTIQCNGEQLIHKK